MYQRIIPARILTSVGIGLLIFSLVFGWVAFSVPDWLQFYEHDGIKNANSTSDSLKMFKKFGLWYKCVFSIDANDFICLLWNKDTPSFVRVAQVLVPCGLSLGCLSLLTACIGFMCRRAFVTTLLFAALFAFLNFLFITIGVTVFANESLVYVERLRLSSNDNPRRWGMWLLVPNLVLALITSVCFSVASMLSWCDYRNNMRVHGMFSHSGDKFNGSVCKMPPSDGNTTTAVKQPFHYQDYPHACYQIHGLNNSQQNPMAYPPPPTYGGVMNPGYQPTPSGFYGYSRPGTPTMYPHSNFDPYYPRHYMTENTEMDELPYTTRSSHHRSRSYSRSHRHSNHRSRSCSPRDSIMSPDNTQKPTQFIPIPVPYYQPQPQPQPQSQPQPQPSAASQPKASSTPNAQSNNPTQPMSYIMPQTQQFRDENIQAAMKSANILNYNMGQPSAMVQNSNHPVYTIAYRPNTGGNILGSNILSGPAATTYVTASRNQVGDISSFNSDSDMEDRDDQAISKRKNIKKININETWAWRKMR
ncbi:unnamed protein product [Adineta steineri]|uniref:Uncharacterized protein n=1 Tax=Adineta steineri TaxID=433720 RepID=A0A815E4Z3_9BILA|nr:unnamed protein product [Adineta steineri]CAF3570704.1 unnamed protein product [Adineta steineri]